MGNNHLDGIACLSRITAGVFAAIGATSLLVTPVQADIDLSQINLELGGEAATGWSVQDIKPCDSGSHAVSLHSAGSADGFVTIWIENVSSTEGDNPEPETDTAEPGELDDHMLFNLVTDPANRLDTNIPMPTTIDNLPQSPDDPNYIRITPLNAGETVTIYWEWELPCETGNEAQGDRLGFDIYYFLEDFIEEQPPSNPPPTVASCLLVIDMLGEVVNVHVDCCDNSTYEDYLVYDPSDQNFLSIDRWTPISCGECVGCGAYPVKIEVTESDDPPPPPEDAEIIGPVYDFIGYRGGTACDSVTFGKPVMLLFDYVPYISALPENTTSVVVAFYNEETGSWEDLPHDTGRVAALGEATAMVTHLSQFAVLAKTSQPPAPPEPPQPPAAIAPPSPSSVEPAHFVFSNIQVTPIRELVAAGQALAFVLRIGERVTITTNLTNDGGQYGSYLADLIVDGQTQNSKTVTLAPGQSQELVFTLSGNTPGNHTIELGSLRSVFVTTVWVNWWLVGGLAAALGLGIWAAWRYGYRRRRDK